MAKVNRFARTRIASTINARYHPDDSVVDSYFLDGRFPGRRESRAVDMTTVKEERGFFYSLFAHRQEDGKNTSEMPFAVNLERLNEDVKGGAKNIDEQINDLADVAVDVTGRATLKANPLRQSWFAGILVKEGEIAAVTTTSGCALLYRGDVLYPLTKSEFDLEGIDYNGNPIEGINDYSAGVAGTIRYSNIAQLRPNDCIILCNRELLEALGQRELLRLLFEAEDQMEAAQQIMTQAAAKKPGLSLQVLLAYVEDVNLQAKTGRLNLGLFNTGSTPTPEELHNGERQRNSSHKLEDKRNNMNRNNDYPDRRAEENLRQGKGAWRQDRPLNPGDTAFEPPLEPVEDYDEYPGNDAYEGDYDDPYRPGYETGAVDNYELDSEPYPEEDYQDDYQDEYTEDYDDGHYDDGHYDDGYYEDGYDDYDDYGDGYDDGYGDGYEDYGDDYGNDYYDDYYDDYGEQERRERVKRFVILGVVILLLLLSIFFIGRKLLKKDTKTTETSEETVNESVSIEEPEDKPDEPAVVQPVETTTQQTEYKPNEEELFDLTFMTTDGETPRAFIASIYGEAEEIHYQFLKRYNPSIPEMDTVMASGIFLKVPLAESGPFKLLDSWQAYPDVWAAYQQGITAARQNRPQDVQPVEPETTDFNQDDSQADDSGDNNDTNP